MRKLRDWARLARRDILAVWLAARDPRVPWPVKLLAAAIAAYALSPIDLIPDVVPVLGYLDDLLLVPAGLYVVTRLIPAPLMAEFRDAAERMIERPKSRAVLAMVLIIWMVAALVAIWIAARWWP